MRLWWISDKGLVRKENQDACATKIIGPYTVAVVCDGMGGTQGGQVASKIAIGTFQKELEANLRDQMTPQQMREAVAYTISLANQEIRKEAAADPEYKRMGTTLVSAIAKESFVMVNNVGDSRAYLVSRSGIRQITRDHSVVEHLVERGDLTPEEARRHPNRNLITRALGPEQSVEADSFEVTWETGDFLLLCSDGLVNTVSDQEILFEVIHGGEPDTCLERLLALAQQRGAPDNVTAILMMNI